MACIRKATCSTSWRKPDQISTCTRRRVWLSKITSTRNRGTQHLLEAERLRAELDLVSGTAVLVAAAFVFDGVRAPESLTVRHVRPDCSGVQSRNSTTSVWPEEDRAGRSAGQRAADRHLGPGLNIGQVRLGVQQFAFSGEEVLLPLPLQMNERPAALTRGQVLEAGERKITSSAYA